MAATRRRPPRQGARATCWSASPSPRPVPRLDAIAEQNPYTSRQPLLRVEASRPEPLVSKQSVTDDFCIRFSIFSTSLVTPRSTSTRLRSPEKQDQRWELATVTHASLLLRMTGTHAGVRPFAEAAGQLVGCRWRGCSPLPRNGSRAYSLAWSGGSNLRIQFSHNWRRSKSRRHGIAGNGSDQSTGS